LIPPFDLIKSGQALSNRLCFSGVAQQLETRLKATEIDLRQILSGWGSLETVPHQNMEGQAVSTRINLAPVARAITTAMLCVMVEHAGAQQFGDAEGGRQLARENCAECHAIDSGTGASANPDAPTFKDLANTPGMTSAALTVALQTAHRNMPNFLIKANERQDIIAYILSLKENH
jgi:mono/diheme cytochrome c family protein